VVSFILIWGQGAVGTLVLALVVSCNSWGIAAGAGAGKWQVLAAHTGSRVVAGGLAAPPTRVATWGMEVPGCTDGPVLGTNVTQTWSVSACV